ncbi:response regulator [Dysgonomonas sp. HDW5A]|uniref:hybrid sensor histidine kinase/response regulator transcription factor n=1 Tax=Dysgonomonas sp. HDW5A TaxID=2714926 RepID=UPI00140E8D5A|nr:two-component regulator propeller domain-containing protein [Dysgonomonas sp. HDW5A]QIK60876.1 response regulator [Dysgonomonas sp. HDW5A]
MYRKFSFSLFFFIFTCISLWGQKINYQAFKNISLGAETSVINCFAQDSQGLIWIGSNKGLFSYDGYSSQAHFTTNEKSNTLIYCIIPLDDNHLCLGTDNGVLFYNYKTDQYEEIPNIQFPSDVRALATFDNVLWIGSLNGLFRYDLKDRKLENVSDKKDTGLPHKTIYSIIKTKNNTLYVGTYDGFCQYIPRSDKFQKINLPTDLRRSNLFVNSLYEDVAHDCIWIGTEGALFRYDPKTKSAEEISFFHNNSIKSLAIDSNNQLLIGTDNGLYIYDQQTKEVQHIVHDSRNEKSLINNIIWGIFIDKENNIWLGTDYGVSLARFNKIFQPIPISQITGVGDGNRFYALYKDSRNNYWLGGTNGLIRTSSLTDEPQNAIWYRMGDKKYPISHNRIRQIYEDKDHNLWIATDGSINRYDYNTKQFVHYNIIDSTHTYNSNWAYHMFEDDNNRLWIATCLGGVFVVDKQKLLKSSGTYIAEYNFSTTDGLSGNFINQIIPDHRGNTWVLLYNNGIDKIDIKTKKITKIPIEYSTKNKNPNYIICDKEGFIWAGFRGGLVRINPEDDTLESIRFDAFGDSEILCMIEEGSHIWLSTTDGIWVVDKYTYNVQRLNATGKSFTSGFFDSQNNKIYLGGVDELAILSPYMLKGDHSYSPIVLTALYINDQLYNLEGNSIRHMKGIELNYKQNNLTFEFSDLIYSEEEENKFVYKLEEVDKDWNILSHNTNRISYSNLEYGKYHLIITKLDVSGKPSDVEYSFTIHITPPWYYTFWAKSFYVLLFVALILWVINFFRVRNNLRIERIEKEKTLELSNLKIDFFTNVSHEFKTPLSLIIAPVSQLLLDIKDSQKKKQLEGVQRNALKLNSLIRQVLDFNRTDSSTNSNLIFSKVEFVEFAKSLFSIYEEGYKAKNINFSFHTNKEKIYIRIDVLKIESVLNNLLSNACKYTSDKGSVVFSLTCKEDENILELSVSDTGIGIPQQEIPYVFKRFYQSSKTAKDKDGTGIGLYLVKTYTEQHGGKITVESEENKGTTITISLPLKNEAATDNQFLIDEGENDESNRPLILIVDDNAEIADFISQVLTSKYRIEIAHNGKMGMEMSLNLHPDLIIADVMMPIMDGLEMSRRIRKHIPTSTIPIILLTAKDDKTTELESININVDAFIPKPFDPQILLSRIEQLLKSKQQIEDKLRIENITTPKVTEVTSLDEKFLSEITQIIEDRIDDSDLNVNLLCTISGISSKQVYRKIKQLTGMSPVEYIRSIRIKKAAMLLAQKKFTIAEVMYMVGFSNHSYFSKCFQAEFGKTPREYLADI